MFLLYIILACAFLVLLWLVSIYNKLVRNRNLVDEAWSGIEVQLKRRANLIPNLILRKKRRSFLKNTSLTPWL